MHQPLYPSYLKTRRPRTETMTTCLPQPPSGVKVRSIKVRVLSVITLHCESWVALWLEHQTPDRKAWVRYQMPPNTLRVHTEYMLVKSVGPQSCGLSHERRGLENISLPFSSIQNLWRLR
ncbi:hypothetical protein TNCV_425841 [Trichonephila clavipes]|nr:hypothetical protein TNCV_425841 [Trichonephila clavipes]